MGSRSAHQIFGNCLFSSTRLFVKLAEFSLLFFLFLFFKPVLSPANNRKLTVAEHFIICSLSLFGIKNSKLEINRSLVAKIVRVDLTRKCLTLPACTAQSVSLYFRHCIGCNFLVFQTSYMCSYIAVNFGLLNQF